MVEEKDKEKIVFGYSRKSPDDSEDTDRSINNQEEIIKINCSGRNWKLQQIFSDKNISGSDRNRKGVHDAIQSATIYKKENPEKEVYLVVKDSKRFARDSSWGIDTLKDLNVYGVKVFSIMDNSFLDHTDLGYRIKSNVDEQPIYDGKIHAKTTQELKKNKSLPCIPAPFGYKYNWIKDSKGSKRPLDKTQSLESWVIDKKDSKIVLNVLNSYVNSVHYKDILKENKISVGKYYRIIKNAKNGLYSGYIYYSKKVKDSKGKVIRTEEVNYKGTYKPIISEELFEKIKEKE